MEGKINQMKNRPLKEKLNRLGPWNFLIEVEEGVFTIPRECWGGFAKNIVAQDYVSRVLPRYLEMLNDKAKSETTVIDIGCNEGWFTLFLHRIGYKKIVGIDSNKENIEKAFFLKEYFNLKNVEFYRADINNYKSKETFDFSLMLGVINHTHNPVGILQNIYEFTNKYLLLDFDSLGDDDGKEKGTMSCQIEQSSQVTSTTDNNLVFQYSKQAIALMMNQAGFGNILQLLPGAAYPVHYKERKRVCLLGKKNTDESGAGYDAALDESYKNAEKLLEYPVPLLKEEGYKGFNIVLYGNRFFGIPHGAMDKFEIREVLDNKKCLIADSVEDVKAFIDKSQDKASDPDERLRDQIRYDAAYELVLESKFAKAREILEPLGGTYAKDPGVMSEKIIQLLGLIAGKTKTEAKLNCHRIF